MALTQLWCYEKEPLPAQVSPNSNILKRNSDYQTHVALFHLIKTLLVIREPHWLPSSLPPDPAHPWNSNLNHPEVWGVFQLRIHFKAVGR